MKEDTIVVKIEFYDPALGREQVVYGEVRYVKGEEKAVASKNSRDLVGISS